MMIFIFIVFVLILYCENFIEKKFNILFILIIIILIIIETIKKGSGTDFYHYYNHYYTALEVSSRFEFLYHNSVVLFRRINLGYHTFLLFYFIILYSLYYFSIKKITPFPITAFFIFFCLTIGLLGSNRQLMAMSIGFFSIAYFLNFKKTVFIFAIIIASLFHQTAIFYLPVLLVTRVINYKWWILFCIIAFIGCLTNYTAAVFYFIIDHIAPENIQNHLKFYRQLPIVQTKMLLFIMGILRRSLPILLLYRFEEDLLKFKHFNIVLNILWISLFTYILLYFDLEYLNARLGFYYIIFEAVLYSWLAAIFVKSSYKYFYLIFIVLFCTFNFIKAVSNYPELYFPFRTVFGSF